MEAPDDSPMMTAFSFPPQPVAQRAQLALDKGARIRTT
jgi:hypothetical protein